MIQDGVNAGTPGLVIDQNLARKCGQSQQPDLQGAPLEINDQIVILSFDIRPKSHESAPAAMLAFTIEIENLSDVRVVLK
jgi:hypothetical protein